MAIDYKNKFFEELRHCLFYITYAKKYIYLEKKNERRKKDNEIAMLKCVIAYNSSVKNVLEDFMTPEDLEEFKKLHFKETIARARELAINSFQEGNLILMIPKKLHDFLVKYIADDEYKKSFKETKVYEVTPK